jgi:hypothetical protein
MLCLLFLLFHHHHQAYQELPSRVDFSSYQHTLKPGHAQTSRIYVHDVQWVPTLSCLVMIVSNRNRELDLRPVDRGHDDFLPISHFFPSVNITAVERRGATRSVQVKCHDVPAGSEGIVQLVSLLYCQVPSKFRDHISTYQELQVDFRELSLLIPLATSTASRHFGKTSRRHPPPHNKEKASVGLCAGGIVKDMAPYLREYVEYYLTIGVAHLYLSYGDYFSLDTDVSWMEQILEDYIREGKVSVSAGPITHYDLEPAYIDAYSKLPFYTSCLWHSKAYDNYTLIVDVDELVILNETTSASLSDAIAQITAQASPKALCGIQLEDYATCLRTNESGRGYGDSYQRRMAKQGMPHYRAKSIVLTQRAKWAECHSPYHCSALLPLEKQDKEEGSLWLESDGYEAGLFKLNESHPIYPLYVLHFVHLHHVREALIDCNSSESSEYSSLWYPKVRDALAARCNSFNKYC